MNWLKKVLGEDWKDDMCFLIRKNEPGSRFKATRQLVDNNGVMELQVVGKTNIYEQIQSHKDSVDINKIIERYREGDVTALDRVKAHYLDLEGAPQTLAEMYSFIRNTSAFFDTLPLEVRKQYDFNVSNFVADIGSENFKKIFTMKAEDVEQILPVDHEVDVKKEVESEVKADA